MAATQDGENVLVENVVQESGEFDKELFLQVLRGNLCLKCSIRKKVFKNLKDSLKNALIKEELYQSLEQLLLHFQPANTSSSSSISDDAKCAKGKCTTTNDQNDPFLDQVTSMDEKMINYLGKMKDKEENER
ncbi:Hypothetical predicted protein [Paramuricea clavata]|uniref:Uncharacterized protein n=1 Tax=Paramuricea clavata TaxID=317549 RepID=A0A6S7HF53_PARCT|nr:Hypothetical predicted protein [Paramuricea clavata]